MKDVYVFLRPYKLFFFFFLTDNKLDLQFKPQNDKKQNYMNLTLTQPQVTNALLINLHQKVSFSSHNLIHYMISILWTMPDEEGKANLHVYIDKFCSDVI